MNCAFDGSGSSDSDGTIASHEWDFGDGWTATEAEATHGYASSGVYTVILTVTDDAGESGSESQLVSIGDTGGAFVLTASGFKVKGVQHATLKWSGANGDDVYVYRDVSPVFTTENDGDYVDNIRKKGGGSYLYRVCETVDVESPNCSNSVEVVF